MRLHESLQEIERINQLVEGGFDDKQAVEEVLAIRRDSAVASLDRIVRAIDYYNSRIEQIEKFKNDATQAAKTIKNRVDAIKLYVKSVMKEFDTKILMGSDCSIKLVKNGGLLTMKLFVQTKEKTLRHVLDPKDIERHEIPQKYLRHSVIYELDTDAIRKDLQDGIPTNLATLEDRGESVRVVM